jgi:hypothetical protein
MSIPAAWPQVLNGFGTPGWAIGPQMMHEYLTLMLDVRFRPVFADFPVSGARSHR